MGLWLTLIVAGLITTLTAVALDPSTWVIVVVIALSNGVSGLVGYLLTGRGRAQGETIEALAKRVSTQKDEIADLRTELAEARTQIKALEDANRMLVRLLQGIPDWKVIVDKLDVLLGSFTPEYREREEQHQRETSELVRVVKGAA